jgi:hypothetical protein
VNPTQLQVLEEGLRLVLSKNEDGPNAGVDEITQHEVDDTVLAAEGNRGLGSLGSQGIETGSFSSR